MHVTDDATSKQFDALRRAARALFGVDAAFVLAGGAGEHDGAKPVHPLADLASRHASAQDGLVVVEDAAADADVAAALAAAGLSAGFYASTVLEAADGGIGGLLCLLDARPRRFAPDDREKLAAFAAVASAILAAEARAVEAARQVEFFRLLADHSTDTLVRGNLDGVRIYVSPAVRTLLGYEPEELVGRRASEINHSDDAPAFGRMMADIRVGRVEQATTEHRMRHKDGRWVWIEAHIRLTREAASGEPDGYVVSVRDVSHRKATEARLSHDASHDPLTGLANRTLFHERLAQEVARSRRTGAHFALFWVDLDRFTEVNDRLGHEAGDVMLRAVADRLKAAVRTEDTVARIGGDEFVVLRVAGGAAGDAAAAAELAARLVACMDAPVDYAGLPVRIGLSVGVALTEVEGFEAERLLRAADGALYRAKDAGRGRAVVAR